MTAEPKIEPKKKGYDLIDLIALISGFEAVGLFIKTYQWAVQIPGLLEEASYHGKTVGAYFVTIGILLLYFSLGCLAVTLTIGLVMERDWARKMAIAIYSLSGLMMLFHGNIVGALLHTAIVVYLCNVRDKFQKTASVGLEEVIPQGPQ